MKKYWITVIIAKEALTCGSPMTIEEVIERDLGKPDKNGYTIVEARVSLINASGSRVKIRMYNDKRSLSEVYYLDERSPQEKLKDNV